MAINGYCIDGYWWLFYSWLLVAILLMAIDGYSIGGCWCLLMIIILMVIYDYSIVSHWWLLMVILLMGINVYYILYIKVAMSVCLSVRQGPETHIPKKGQGRAARAGQGKQFGWQVFFCSCNKICDKTIARKRTK
jgi:hypothetical protein